MTEASKLLQINRQYRLQIGNGNSGEGLDISNLQVTFDISKSSNNKDKTNSASIEIYNLSKDNLKVLDTDYTSAIFSAGYRDIGIKRLFAGQITDVTTRKSGTDIITQILIGANYTELNHQVMSSITPPGTKVKDAVDMISKSLPGVFKSVFNGTNLNNPILYGYPMQGTPRQMMNQLASEYSLDWQIDDGVLYVHDNNRANSEKFEEAYIISRGTGLIENAYRVSGDVRRAKDDKAKIQGVQWKMLLNPDIIPGDIVKLEDTLITGYFKITDMRHYGGWRDNDWYTDCRGVAIEKVNKA